jgi:hypothetical protein
MLRISEKFFKKKWSRSRQKRQDDVAKNSDLMLYFFAEMGRRRTVGSMARDARHDTVNVGRTDRSVLFCNQCQRRRLIAKDIIGKNLVDVDGPFMQPVLAASVHHLDSDEMTTLDSYALFHIWFQGR